ncbi:MAG: hypothetical protein H0T12_09120 [Actinobacteria bacterium]|nr:hypothetical protein [Actinomycetota bacterium]
MRRRSFPEYADLNHLKTLKLGLARSRHKYLLQPDSRAMSRRSIVIRAPSASLAAAIALVPVSVSRAFQYADRAHGRTAVDSFLSAFDRVLDGTELWAHRVILACEVVAAASMAALAAASLLAWAIATLH